MKQQMILIKIRDIILPYLDEPCEIEMRTHLIQDLMINSFDYINIIADIENEFKIQIDGFDVYHIKDLIKFIEQNHQKYE